jgi:uncharacterized membrane-anchored protein YhcB (DUF1043 family)
MDWKWAFDGWAGAAAGVVVALVISWLTLHRQHREFQEQIDRQAAVWAQTQMAEGLATFAEGVVGMCNGIQQSMVAVQEGNIRSVVGFVRLRAAMLASGADISVLIQRAQTVLHMLCVDTQLLDRAAPGYRDLHDVLMTAGGTMIGNLSDWVNDPSARHGMYRNIVQNVEELEALFRRIFTPATTPGLPYLHV